MGALRPQRRTTAWRVLVGATAADVVRLAPPLIFTEDEAARFVSALPSILDAVSSKETSS